MAILDSIEVKFSSIISTPTKTTVTAKVFKVVDGGLSASGGQLYTRTLLIQKTFLFDAGWDTPRILTSFKALLDGYNATFALNCPVERRICTL